MKKRLFTALLSGLLAALVMLSSLAAAGETDAAQPVGSTPAAMATEIADNVLSFQIAAAQSANYSDWFYSALLNNVGSEWYILSLIQYGQPVDAAACAEYLNANLADARVLSASEQLKYALVYHALGASDNEYLQKALNESVGAQGVMSYIYGLHLLNNGLINPLYSKEALVEALLDQRKSDGGWAVMGNFSDTDVTAMALQALSPYYQTDEAVRNAVEGALSFLSAKQQNNGAFLGFGGAENPESTAQVLIALCALGIDPAVDERFVKNGVAALDGLMVFALGDGSFCHQIGAGYNATATLQSFMAAVSLKRFYGGEGSFYLFDGLRATLDRTGQESAANAQSAQAKTPASGSTAKRASYKLTALLGCLGLLLLTMAVLWLKGKRNYKNFLFTALCFAVIAAIILLTNFQSSENYYSGERVKKPEAVGEVSMTIRCDTISAYTAQNEFIPADGILLPMTQFQINQGETAYDILTQAAREYRIQLDSTGSGISLLYVKGIGYIYEYEFGEQSGWMYYVNGIAPSVNAAEYTLSDGDVIQWMYSRDIGQDLKDYIIKPGKNQ